MIHNQRNKRCCNRSLVLLCLDIYLIQDVTSHKACLTPSMSQLCSRSMFPVVHRLTHWCQVMHICVGNLIIIGSDNGLSPGRRQAIIWTNAGILLIGPLGTNFSEILIGISNIFIQENAFENVVCELASICLGLNVLTYHNRSMIPDRGSWLVSTSLKPRWWLHHTHDPADR